METAPDLRMEDKILYLGPNGYLHLGIAIQEGKLGEFIKKVIGDKKVWHIADLTGEGSNEDWVKDNRCLLMDQKKAMDDLRSIAAEGSRLMSYVR